MYQSEIQYTQYYNRLNKMDTVIIANVRFKQNNKLKINTANSEFKYTTLINTLRIKYDSLILK